MSTSTVISPKQSVSFRWNSDLVKHLKEMAKQQNRSLSNFTETILSKFLESTDTPNDATKASYQEAMSGKELETLDLNNFKGFVKSL